VIYSIVGTGNIGKTLATYFAKARMEVALANTRGAEAVEPIVRKFGGTVAARSLDEALEADVIYEGIVGDAPKRVDLRSFHR
jgi:hypothetical protein